MPTTAAGWALFALLCVSGCATSATATTLFLSVSGRVRYTKGDITLAYLFGTVTIIAALLFIAVEPPKF